LGVAKLQLAVHLRRRGGDPGRPAQQVEPSDREGDQLAWAHARVGGEQDQRPVARVDRGGEPLDLRGVQEVRLAPLPLRCGHVGDDVAGEFAALNGTVEHHRQHGPRLCPALDAKSTAGEAGEPLLDRQCVDRVKRSRGEGRQDLQVERLAVVPHGGGCQHLRLVPAFGPLAELHLASGRVDPTAAGLLGSLDLDQEPLGVDLAGEHLAARAAGRVAIANRVADLAVARALLDRGH
jgi:hypothetical protein